nr:RNA-directed DNA polymerase, eukaryota [Tanacetum cinerariifolium]
SNMASILVNRSPAAEFPFFCGLKQGDHLAPLIFILVMESLHISVSRAVNDGVFKGLQIQGSAPLSHLFYADDAVFIGECQVLGVGVPPDIVNQGASRIGCAVMQTPFKYLGVIVGDHMSRYSAWSNTIQKVRDGTKSQQWSDMLSMLEIRSTLDYLFLPSSGDATRCVKYVPIKVNVFAWRRIDRLPTRGNLVTRRVTLDSSLCPDCGLTLEDSQHLFFRCDLAKYISQRICRWWNLQWVDVSSFVDWYSWFAFIRLSVKLKTMLEGVFYTSWWHI